MRGRAIVVAAVAVTVAGGGGSKSAEKRSGRAGGPGGWPPRSSRPRSRGSAPSGPRCCARARCGRSPRATSPSTCSSTRCTSSASRARRRTSSASATSSSAGCAAPSSARSRSRGSTAARRARSRRSPSRWCASARRPGSAAARDGRTVVLVRGPGGRTRTVVRGARVGGASFADPYEPGLSADGSKLVYTLAAGRVDEPAGAGSQVLVRDVATGRTTVASRTNGGARADGFSADPAISPDGRFVVFTSDARNLGAGAGPAGLFLRDLRTGRTRRIPTGTARVLDPVASRRARVVAFTAMNGATSRVMAWTRRTGAVTLVSRARHAGNGVSEDPSISADGRRVAFASTATNVDPRKADDARAIFVRDRAAGTTRLVSDPLAAYPKGAVKPPPVKPAPAPVPEAP